MLSKKKRTTMKEKDLEKEPLTGEQDMAEMQAETETTDTAAEAMPETEAAETAPEDETSRLQAEIADWKDKNARLYAD
ncbi:MAG: hypothetical protein K2H70_05495, partial [Bacteroidales bacterium]|nr:hypothetical protein [Bacteroidales bacterium]